VEGEESEVWSVSRMAWGPEGLLAGGAAGQTDVPADADVVLSVVLHQCLPGATSWNETIQELSWRKENGNNYFRRKQFVRAKRSYAAGLDIFKGDFEPPEDLQDAEAASAAAATMCGDVGANLAAVHLELGDATAAKDAATVALSINTDHVKALYRAAKACYLLDEFDECEIALQRALGLEPRDAKLLQLDAEFKRKKQKYATKSKRLAEKAVRAFEYEDQEVPGGDKAANGQGRHMLQDLGRWVSSKWRHFAAAAVIVALLLASLTLLPRKYRPYCWITSVFALLMTSAVLSICEDGTDVAKKCA